MLRKIMPHIAIIISGMYVVFFCIDKVNSAMAFINNNITKGLLLVLCIVTVFNAALLIHDSRASLRRRQQRQRGENAPIERVSEIAPRARRSTPRYSEPVRRERY